MCVDLVKETKMKEMHDKESQINEASQRQQELEKELEEAIGNIAAETADIKNLEKQLSTGELTFFIRYINLTHSISNGISLMYCLKFDMEESLCNDTELNCSVCKLFQLKAYALSRIFFISFYKIFFF